MAETTNSNTSLSLLALMSKENDKTSCSFRLHLNFTKLYHNHFFRVPLNPLRAKYSCYVFKCRPKLKQVSRRRYLFVFFEWKIHINGNYRFAPSEINLTQTKMAHLTSSPQPLIYDLLKKNFELLRHFAPHASSTQIILENDDLRMHCWKHPLHRQLLMLKLTRQFDRMVI